MRLPRVVQLRMLMNVAIDLLVGAIPILGDAADVFWKANSKNMALLERHANDTQPRIGRRLAVRRRHPRDCRGCPGSAGRGVRLLTVLRHRL